MIKTKKDLTAYIFGDDFTVNGKPYRMHDTSGSQNPCRVLPLDKRGGCASGPSVYMQHSGGKSKTEG